MLEEAEFAVQVEGVKTSSTCWHKNRYLPYTHDRQLSLLDFFHMRSKTFTIEFGASITERREELAIHWWTLRRDVFLTSIQTVVVLIDEQNDSNKWTSLAILDLDYETSTAFVRKYHRFQQEFSQLLSSCYFKLLDSNGSFEFFFGGYDENELFAVYANTVFTFYDLKVETKKIRLPEQSTPIGDSHGFFYVFPLKENGRPEFGKLIGICTKTNDQTTLELSVNQLDGYEEEFTSAYEVVWIGRILLLRFNYHVNAEHNDHTFVLTMDRLQWQKIDLQFNCLNTSVITDHDNVFLVETLNDVHNTNTRSYYRFAIKRPETLIDLAFLSIRRHLKHNPKAFNESLSYLPIEFKCPFV